MLAGLKYPFGIQNIFALLTVHSVIHLLAEVIGIGLSSVGWSEVFFGGDPTPLACQILQECKFLLLGQTSKLEKVNLTPVKVGKSDIPKSDFATNLGLIWDIELFMQRHINNRCTSGFFQLCKIAHLRKYLFTKATETNVHVFVLW